jgi:ethanolamine utilization microcompartment shell protein EutL
VRRLWLAAIAAGAIATVLAFAFQPGAAGAQKSAQDLRVLPEGTSLAEVRKQMKVMAKAVGKRCDDCHDVKAFDKDSEMKEVGREMMRLVEATNARLAREGFKARIDCATCHRGKEKPPTSGGGR